MAVRYFGNEEDGLVEIGAPHSYAIGDVVFWATPSGSGEYTFIGHPKGDKAGKILVLALGAELGFAVDASECAPTGRSNPQRGREYRQRYFRNHPRGLEGNP